MPSREQEVSTDHFCVTKFVDEEVLHGLGGLEALLCVFLRLFQRPGVALSKSRPTVRAWA